MKLVIAEKPALGKDIALAIPGKSEFGDGFITVSDYTVTWAVGHLVELVDPTEGEKWTLSNLPLYWSPWPVQPSKRTLKQFNVIKKLLQQCESVIHAGDPDDEGQLIVDEILDLCGNTKPVYRLSTNDNNHAVIRKALNQLKPNEQFVAEGQAALARSISDLLFGMNLTRFYTIAGGGNLVSVGRVQTPTLGLVVQRDYEIENHIVKSYYQLMITVTGGKGTSVQLMYVINKETDPVDENGHITDPVFYENLIAGLQQRSGLLQVTHKLEKKSAPLPFNLTKLQTTANKAFGFSTAKTLKLTQSLRDKHKAITYNRTDCQYLNDEHFNDAPELIQQVQSNLSKTFSNLSTDKKPRCFNSANVSAHHAIIPTLKEIKMSDLSADEAKIYELIATYYLVQFMPPAEIDKTTASIQLDNHCFTATSSQVINPSWKTVLGIKEKDEPGFISKIPNGSYPADLTEHEILQKETKPPARYTEASLTTDMTSVAKYCNDPKIKQILINKDDGKKGENGSIGTVATRSDIVEKLIDRGFIERKKKQIISTALGRQFYNYLPETVKSIDITAYWWLVQEEIKAGKQPKESLINSVLQTVQAVIAQGAESVPQFQGGKAGKGKKPASEWKKDTCPDCGQAIHFIESVKKPFWGHVDRDSQCQTRFNDVKGKPAKWVQRPIDETYPCPACGNGYLQRRESKKKRGNFFWGCSNWKNGCKHIAWDDKGKPQR